MTERLRLVPALPRDVLLRPRPARPPFGLEGASFHGSAAAALRAGIGRLGLRPGAALLVPDDAPPRLGLARLGLELRPYDELSEEAFEPLLGEGARALLLRHALGVPVPAARWRSWCDGRGLLLLEDATEAFLAESEDGPAGSHGDLALVGVGEAVGAGLGTALVLGAHSPEEGGGLRGRLRAHAADPGAAGRRRAAYSVLLEGLGERVPEGLRELPPGAAPHAFPLRADEGLAARLAAAGIEARPDGGALLLPVHQELGPRRLARIAAAAGARAPEELRLERVASLDGLREEWNALAEPTGSPFALWEWQELWWRQRGGGRTLATALCRRADGSLAAILPLYAAAGRPVRALRFLGHGPGDRLGPICAPGDRPAAARALRRLVREAGASLLLGDQLPADEGWPALVGGRVLRREGSPVVRLRGRGWDELLAARSSNLRGQVRRRERALAREHELEFRLAAPDELDDALATLRRLHRARWGGGTAFAGADEAFHRAFAPLAAARGALRLWTLRLDGADVAAWYGFRVGGVESYYQAGRDPAWEHASVGSVLLAHTIRAAAEEGAREYWFLRGGESFKYRFADSDPGVETIVAGDGPLPLAAQAAAAGRRAVRTLTRRA